MRTLWCASYFSLSPRRIATVSSTDGSPTKTCWKRRSSAGSFSMRSRYSSSVVAPIIRSSPRASIGLSMLPASIADSPAAPAPTTVCSSSMNVMTWPSESLISSSTALSRSSNSPRYFAPATIAPRSSESTRRPLQRLGTSPATMRCASPSTTAVLPTPGSPISTGLFLVRRDSTCTTRRISAVAADDRVELARPRAAAVRSTPYFSSAWYVASGSGLVTRPVPRTAVERRRAARRPSAPRVGEQLLGGAVDGRRVATSRCSVETYSSRCSRRASCAPGEHRESAPREYDGCGDRRAGGRGQLRAARLGAGASSGRGVDADGLEQRPAMPSGWCEQRDEQVGRLDLGLPAVAAASMAALDRLLAAGGELRCVHESVSCGALGSGRCGSAAAAPDDDDWPLAVGGPRARLVRRAGCAGRASGAARRGRPRARPRARRPGAAARRPGARARGSGGRPRGRCRTTVSSATSRSSSMSRAE